MLAYTCIASAVICHSPTCSPAHPSVLFVYVHFPFMPKGNLCNSREYNTIKPFRFIYIIFFTFVPSNDEHREYCHRTNIVYLYICNSRLYERVCLWKIFNQIEKCTISHTHTHTDTQRWQQQHIKHNKSRRDTGCRKTGDKKASRERITQKHTTCYMYIYICIYITVSFCPRLQPLHFCQMVHTVHGAHIHQRKQHTYSYYLLYEYIRTSIWH